MEQPRHSTRTMILAALAILFVTLACGSEVSPTQVGRISQDEQPEEVSSATGASEEDPANLQPTSTAPPAPTQAGPETYQVGDIISIGDMIMVVLGWDNPAGDGFAEPDEGNEFVEVELILINQTEDTKSISSLLQMSLKDDTNQSYDIDLMASVASGTSSPDGEISPGERVRGKVGFQVPVKATGLVFVFDADVFGLGKVFVELGPEPVSLEPPADLPGEQEQVRFNLGDIIEAGDVVMSVLGWELVEGNDFFEPDPGEKFIAVDLILANRSDETISISTGLQITLKDSTGQIYDPDFNATVAVNRDSPDGGLVPGERIRGVVGFSVPEDGEGLEFVYDADIFGFGKVVVSLGPEPQSFPPPATLPGERPVETSAPGERVEVGKFAVTVNEVTFPTGDNFNQPEEGYRFLVVDLTVENLSDTAENFSSALQLHLKDATGQIYSLELSAVLASGGSSPDGELSAGEQLRGQAGFQVPVGAQGIVLVFESELFEVEKAFISLPDAQS